MVKELGRVLLVKSWGAIGNEFRSRGFLCWFSSEAIIIYHIIRIISFGSGANLLWVRLLNFKDTFGSAPQWAKLWVDRGEIGALRFRSSSFTEMQIPSKFRES